MNHLNSEAFNFAVISTKTSSPIAHGQKIEELLHQTKDLQLQVGALQTKVEEGFEQVNDGLDTVMATLGAQDKALLELLELSRTSKLELAELFQKLNQEHYSTDTLEKMTEELTEMIDQNIKDLPASIAQQWTDLSSRTKNIIDVKDKFKLKIPIIPSILVYEKEVSWNFKKLLTDLSQAKGLVN